MRIRGEREFFLKKISLSFFLRSTKIGPSDFIGINRKSALLDEGYAWVPKTRDFIENSGKNLENPKFLVFLKFNVLTVRIFETRVKVTLRDESYAWVPKSQDFVGFPREIVNTYKYV